jgi:hypothetical protein
MNPTRRARERCSARGRGLGAAPRRLAVDLTPQAVEQVAIRVAQLLAERGAQAEPELIGAGELARKLKVERPWVYRHWRELGGFRLGEGPRAPLRFELAQAVARMRRLRSEDREGGKRC